MEQLFCKNCDNLLTTKIGYNEAKDKSKLIHYCRNCNESFDKSDKGESVYHLNYNLDNIKRHHIVNKYSVNIYLATIFNTLDSFVEKKILKLFYVKEGKAIFC